MISTIDNREGRFLMQATDAAGLVTAYQYEPKFGNKTWEKDPLGNEIFYTYNKFGILTGMQTPLGNTSITRNWVTPVAANLAFTETITTEGKPTTQTWYDILGREVKLKTNLYNKESYISTVYNNDGTVEKTSLPYFSSNPSSWKSYTYDNYKRPKTVTALGLTTSTVYSNGYATTTYPDGNVEETIHNKTGETTEVSSNNGTVSYHYNAFGRPDIITAYSATTMEYDKYGNQTKLIDPDAGTNDYHYNAFGELTYQKDANNNTFTMLYNNKGQLTNQNCNNTQFSTAYTYYANGMLQKETLGNGNSKEYIYNSLGQLTTLNEKIDGTTYTHEYTYNNRGKVLTYKYPGGYTITNEYDACGYKTGVKAGGSYIWRLSGSDYINEMGQIKEYLLGSNNIKTKREYNSNFELTGINTKKADNTVLFDYTYVFDHSTGNLTSRKDNTRNLTESFGYDTQQRLETAKKNNVSTLSIDYYNNGNIDIKSDAGTYAYLSNKPHAVTQITQNNNSMIHPLAQQITYNPFQKTATINESSYSYTITYGTDRQRTKTVLKNNNTVVETRIYSGLYEKYTAGSSTKELHYIPTPTGTVAVHIKTNGSGGTTYYLLKDYLGSIMKVVDASGNVMEEHSYDAWGNHRNPATWALSDFASTLGIRGYTGHEHLPHFQLVNMNGRMYDPVLGRMLSPDNFVPDATNSQDYNRYTYARNNPLKYTDPTGEYLLYLDFGISWSQQGGFSLSVGFGVGFKNGLSAGIYMGYGFGNNTWDFGVNATYGGGYVSAGYNTQVGWNVGTGYSYGAQVGIFSFSVFSAGGNYSENGGFSTNVWWANYNQYSGFSMNPSFGVGYTKSFIRNYHYGFDEIVYKRESCFPNDDDAYLHLKNHGIYPGYTDEDGNYHRGSYWIDEISYKEKRIFGKKVSGRTDASFTGNRLDHLSITIYPHKTVRAFNETFDHELIHAYDFVKYRTTTTEYLRELKAYGYSDRIRSGSSMSSYEVNYGAFPKSEIPAYLNDIPNHLISKYSIPLIPIPEYLRIR